MSRINWTVSSPATRNATATLPTSDAGTCSFGPMAGGFAVAGPWAAIYRLAYEQALAANAPSRLQRMMEPCWN